MITLLQLGSRCSLLIIVCIFCASNHFEVNIYLKTQWLYTAVIFLCLVFHCYHTSILYILVLFTRLFATFHYFPTFYIVILLYNICFNIFIIISWYKSSLVRHRKTTYSEYMRQAKQLGHVVDAFKESITTNDEKVNQMQSGITAHLLQSHIVTYCFLFFFIIKIWCCFWNVKDFSDV